MTNAPLLEQSFVLFLLRSVALSLGWLLIAIAARRFSATWLSTWWRAGFVALLGLGAVSLTPAQWHIGVIPRLGESRATTWSIGSPLEVLRAEGPTEPLRSHATVPLRKSDVFTYRHFVWLWSAGVVVLLVRLTSSVARVHRLVRGAVPIASSEWRNDAAQKAAYFELSCPVSLLISPAVAAPFVAGVIRPVIIVPAVALHWSAEQRRTVLRHEFAHIARRDLAFQWLAELVLALHWPNPLVWMARRRLTLAQERAADDAVVAGGISHLDYAAFLTDAARQGRQLTRELVLAPMARQSTLGRRIARLLDPRQRRTPMNPAGRFLVGMFALVVAFVLGLTGLRAQDEAAAKPKKPNSPSVKATPIEQSWTRTYRDTYHLNPLFAEHFRGSSDEALVAFRKALEAAEIILPAEKVKLELAPDKNTLTTEFGVPFLWMIQTKFKPFLREHGWWGVPLNAEEELIIRELKPLADAVEKERKRAAEAAAEISAIRLANRIVDPDPENFHSRPTTAEGNTVELEKQLNEQSALVMKLKKQLEAISKLQPEQMNEVMRVLKIEDPVLDRTMILLNEARRDEAVLASTGLGDKHPKIRGVRAQIAEFSRQLTACLSTVQQNRATNLEIEQGVLADLNAKLNEARPTSVADNNKLAPYLEAKSRYLMAKKVFEAAQRKYSSELFQRGIE